MKTPYFCLIKKLSHTICRFNAIPLKIPISFFAGIAGSIPKSIWNLKGLSYSQKVLKKKSKSMVSYFVISKLTMKQVTKSDAGKKTDT